MHMFFSTAARTLLAIQEMGVDNVGIVLDLGHSLFAKETPADAVQLVRAAASWSASRSTTTGASGTTTCGRLGPPDRDARVLARAAPDRLERADPARPVPVPRGPGRGGARQHPHDPRLDARSTASISTRSRRQERQDALAAQRLVLDLLLGARRRPQARERSTHVDTTRSSGCARSPAIRRRDLQMVYGAKLATSAATSRPPTSWPRSTSACCASTPSGPTTRSATASS